MRLLAAFFNTDLHSTMHWLVALGSIGGQALSPTLEGLQTIYRVQFPVLCKSEQNPGYDQNGRTISENRDLLGVGSRSRKSKEVADITSGTVERMVMDAREQSGSVERTIVCEVPFTRCDQEPLGPGGV